MGLFDKKFCDICGDKIGFLGNRKLEDGNLCKNCAAKLSPWFSDRRSSTVAEIREQLQYREDNKAAVAAFRVTRSIGKRVKLLIDEDNRKFMVTSASKLQEANPDVMDFSQMTGCDIDVTEHKSEMHWKDKEGKQKSYTPPRYEYSYSFDCILHVNHPYFDEIRFDLSTSSVEVGTKPVNQLANKPEDYKEYEAMGKEIKSAVLLMKQKIRQDAVSAAQAAKPVECPYCGATTTPDANGCCEYCGSRLRK